MEGIGEDGGRKKERKKGEGKKKDDGGFKLYFKLDKNSERSGTNSNSSLALFFLKG